MTPAGLFYLPYCSWNLGWLVKNFHIWSPGSSELNPFDYYIWGNCQGEHPVAAQAEHPVAALCKKDLAPWI